MIDLAYRDAYARVFREMLAAAPGGRYDESALPSYTHANPAMAWLFWRRLDAAFALAGDVSGGAVLDFGCGGAVTFRYLAARGCRIAGCDPEAEALAREVCRRLAIDAEIRAGIEDFAGRRFDRILALDVLEHIEDLDRYLGQFAALLSPGGRLVVSGPTENWLYRLGRRLAGFSGHYHVRNIYDIEARLAARGFRRLGIATLYPGVPLFRVSAWAPPPAQ
jgi:2-polyprenyl-3-methyl-5-hydroxy-6-metoxy-1,4-benzoquinol methylase